MRAIRCVLSWVGRRRLVEATAGIVVSVVILAGALASPPETPGTGTINGVVRHPSVAQFETVVYIDEDNIPGGKPKTPPQAVLDQKRNEFIPRVLPVVVGTKVDFINSDPFDHNVFSPEEDYDLGLISPGERLTHKFKTPGIYRQLCRIHPQMLGFILVLKNVFFAKTDKEGRFRIEDVPAGTWHLKVWNEKLGPADLEKRYPVKVQPDQVVWVELEIK